MKLWCIYALLDPESGVVRYVGKTHQHPFIDRLRRHQRDSKAGSKSPVHCWIRKLDHAPRFMELQTGTGDWKEAERSWISKFGGPIGSSNHLKLLNILPGGEGIDIEDPKTISRLKRQSRSYWDSPEAKEKARKRALNNETLMNPWSKPGHREKMQAIFAAKKKETQRRCEQTIIIKLHRDVISAVRVIPGVREDPVDPSQWPLLAASMDLVWDEQIAKEILSGK